MTFQVIYDLMEKLCLYDISIHTHFHQNQSINECARNIFAWNWSYMTSISLKVILHFINFFCLHWHSWRVLIRLGVKQIIYFWKRLFEIFRWPYVTFNDLWVHTPFFRRIFFYLISIHINVYQNQFINECAGKKKAKIP